MATTPKAPATKPASKPKAAPMPADETTISEELREAQKAYLLLHGRIRRFDEVGANPNVDFGPPEFACGLDAAMASQNGPVGQNVDRLAQPFRLDASDEFRKAGVGGADGPEQLGLARVRFESGQLAFFDFGSVHGWGSCLMCVADSSSNWPGGLTGCRKELDPKLSQPQFFEASGGVFVVCPTPVFRPGARQRRARRGAYRPIRGQSREETHDRAVGGQPFLAAADRLKMDATADTVRQTAHDPAEHRRGRNMLLPGDHGRRQAVAGSDLVSQRGRRGNKCVHKRTLCDGRLRSHHEGSRLAQLRHLVELLIHEAISPA